ncbi:MAG: adenylate kinase family protein, partial [Anaerolineales bacterium]
PKTPGKCDVDGSELYQREDDKAETVKNRIRVYFTQTAPLIEYYRSKGLLSEIDGAKPIEEVTAELLASVR